MTSDDATVAVGGRVRVRGDRWTIVSTTRHQDCRSVRLSGCGGTNQGTIQTLLLPFDRIHPVAAPPRLRVTGRRRWAHHVSQAILSAHPFGGLHAAATSSFDLLPFQLEPALAMLRHARLRILIADEVGLGKTIQAGLMIDPLRGTQRRRLGRPKRSDPAHSALLLFTDALRPRGATSAPKTALAAVRASDPWRR